MATGSLVFAFSVPNAVQRYDKKKTSAKNGCLNQMEIKWESNANRIFALNSIDIRIKNRM